MALKQFVPSKSGFWNLQTRTQASYGSWKPSYYEFVMKGKDQWLVVSDKPWVEFDGELTRLQPVNVLTHVSGMSSLEAPGTYAKHHKVFA